MSDRIEFTRMTCARCKLPLAHVHERDVIICPGCHGWNRPELMAQGADLISGTADPGLKMQLDAALAQHRLKP